MPSLHFGSHIFYWHDATDDYTLYFEKQFQSKFNLYSDAMKVADEHL